MWLLRNLLIESEFLYCRLVGRTHELTFVRGGFESHWYIFDILQTQSILLELQSRWTLTMIESIFLGDQKDACEFVPNIRLFSQYPLVFPIWFFFWSEIWYVILDFSWNFVTYIKKKIVHKLKSFEMTSKEFQIYEYQNLNACQILVNWLASKFKLICMLSNCPVGL